MFSLYDEAVRLRQQIESIVSDDLPLFTSSFPINACKHASQLFCYHMGLKGYSEPLKVVFGVSNKRRGDVGHWWVETGGILIDLTADQFNQIDDEELSYKIRVNRKYRAVYCCPVSEAPHYKVFSPIPRQAFIWDLSEISEDYIESLEGFYNLTSM